MDLFRAFKNFIDQEHLFSSGDPLLLAVSGGMDSVVLCALCQEAGFNFHIAHANFGLRGAESQRDEDFVRQLAAKYGRELWVKKFDTEVYAKEQKVSIQVAARELRYAWWREIAGHRWILTAHHEDDNIETLLMHFFKGTGIAGLRAILPKQGRLLRPLLFASKEELQQFARERSLDWVEDSSNAADKYTRNALRHRLIPLVQELFPGALQQMGENISRFREIEILYRQSIEQIKSSLLEQKGEEVRIPVLKLKKMIPLSTIVYEIIRAFGFSSQKTGEVMGLLDSGSGKYIRSSTHRILKDRNWLIISAHAPVRAETILIESPTATVLYANGKLKLEKLAVDHPVGQLSGDPGKLSGTPPSIALLDAAQIQFPLLLRKWRKGDYFYPLGLRKKKKLARFFIDQKLSLADKEKVWVIEMDKKIIWVVGLRIDDRYKIGPGTREVLEIKSGLA